MAGSFKSYTASLFANQVSQWFSNPAEHQTTLKALFLNPLWKFWFEKSRVESVCSQSPTEWFWMSTNLWNPAQPVPSPSLLEFTTPNLKLSSYSRLWNCSGVTRIAGWEWMCKGDGMALPPLSLMYKIHIYTTTGACSPQSLPNATNHLTLKSPRSVLSSPSPFNLSF